MEESVVRGSIADIAAKASELAGRTLKVELKVESESRNAKPVGEAQSASGTRASGPDPVEIVERVFRGTRLTTKARGES
jgi:hypothetical protein